MSKDLRCLWDATEDLWTVEGGMIWQRWSLLLIPCWRWDAMGCGMGCGMGGGMGCGMGCGMRLHLRHVHVLGYDLLLQGGDPAEQRRDGFNYRRR